MTGDDAMSPEEFAEWVAERTPTSHPSVDQSGTLPTTPDPEQAILAIRASSDQFMALGSEVAAVIGKFYKDLVAAGTPTALAEQYTNAWAIAYMTRCFNAGVAG